MAQLQEQVQHLRPLWLFTGEADNIPPAALLDRLTHKAHILEFSGAESYRFRTRLQRTTRQHNGDDNQSEVNP